MCLNIFVKLSNKYFFLNTCIYHILFIHSSIGRHLDCFRLLAVVNNTKRGCLRQFVTIPKPYFL